MAWPRILIVAVALGAGACRTSGGASVESSGSAPSKAEQKDEEPRIPRRPTPVDQLEPDGLSHTQVLRIDQDFHPNDDYEIALDAWVDEAKPDELFEVRMWWMDTSKNDERSVFGKGVRRHIDLGYERLSPTAWSLSILAGSQRYVFDVELSDAGVVQAYADVEVADGSVLQHVLVSRSTLVARKVLGLPVGLKRMDVEGEDSSGNPVSGHLHALED
jgi:hypothetical protein